MPNTINLNETYSGKTVLVTGHTGFKGSWLCEWLLMMGAKVVGYSLEPPTQPALFDELELGARIATDIRADVRSLEDFRAALAEHQPDFVFHLAAQPLVRESFDDPLLTFETNAIGTANILEAVRLEQRDCVVLLITTDKVYENREWLHAYREVDPLGGHDPYSASKACAELVISSYRRSFFSAVNDGSGPKISVASARGGNVIGGGDWAKDRIVPDCMKALATDESLPVRNKTSTRPWQHVLELLSGYLRLGALIAKERFSDAENPARLWALCDAFNFGPPVSSNRTVLELVLEMFKSWPGEWEDRSNPAAVHEAGKLNLSIDKAFHLLGWEPKWTFEQSVQQTVQWYRAFYASEDGRRERVQKLTQLQIREFIDA